MATSPSPTYRARPKPPQPPPLADVGAVTLPQPFALPLHYPPAPSPAHLSVPFLPCSGPDSCKSLPEPSPRDTQPTGTWPLLELVPESGIEVTMGATLQFRFTSVRELRRWAAVFGRVCRMPPLPHEASSSPTWQLAINEEGEERERD